MSVLSGHPQSGQTVLSSGTEQQSIWPPLEDELLELGEDDELLEENSPLDELDEGNSEPLELLEENSPLDELDEGNSELLELLDDELLMKHSG